MLSKLFAEANLISWSVLDPAGLRGCVGVWAARFVISNGTKMSRETGQEATTHVVRTPPLHARLFHIQNPTKSQTFHFSGNASNRAASLKVSRHITILGPIDRG